MWRILDMKYNSNLLCEMAYICYRVVCVVTIQWTLFGDLGDYDKFWWQKEFLSLTAQEVVKMTTSSAASNENFIEMTLLSSNRPISQIP